MTMTIDLIIKKSELNRIYKDDFDKITKYLRILKVAKFVDFDDVFGFLALFCVGSTDLRRNMFILDDFGAKRKKEGLPAAKISKPEL